jgi:hypothetical protein
LDARLSEMFHDKGFGEVSIEDVRRTINLAVLMEPQRLKEAMRRANAKFVEMKNDVPIPTQTEDWPSDLKGSEKGAYGVFPANMNKEERAFAELLDEDKSGTIQWWLRNPENVRWATRLVLPTGKRFFPGIPGRSSRDAIALVEIKDDGETGRLQSDSNAIKIRVEHREYRKVCWTYRQHDKKWVRARFDDGLGRILPFGAFDLKSLVLIE